MTYVGDTGQGATLTLSTTGTVGVCNRQMTLPTWVMEKIDASCLSTQGFMRYIPGDLTDPGDIEVEAIFAATDAIPPNGVVEDFTVTFPIGDPANAAPATLTGSGFISSVTLPNMAINELMVITMTLSFNGDTGPTYTPEALT